MPRPLAERGPCWPIVAVLALLGWTAGALGGPDGDVAAIDTDRALRSAETGLAKLQVERLMNAGLPFAEKMLAEHGEFAPFGAVMRVNGLIQVVGTDSGPEGQDADEIFARLARGLHDDVADGSALAVATFALVELREPGNGEIVGAVHAALEHREGYCVDVYYPTVRRDDVVGLGEAFAGVRSGTFFDRCTPHE